MSNLARWLAAAAASLVCAALTLSALQSASLASAQSSQVPTEVPLYEQFNDINPCTGSITTYTFTGTARVQAFDDHVVLVGRGSVVTTDGFSGGFNRTFVFQGDRMVHLRFHDVEISADGTQKIVFAVGLFHETSVNGEPVVSFTHFSGPRCV